MTKIIGLLKGTIFNGRISKDKVVVGVSCEVSVISKDEVDENSGAFVKDDRNCKKGLLLMPRAKTKIGRNGVL